MNILSHIRNLTKHSAIYAISTAFQKLPGLLLLPIYTSLDYIPSRSEFGDYAMLYTFIAFMYFFYTYGMDSSLLRFFFLSDRSRKTVFSTTFLVLFLTSIVTTILLLAFSEPLAVLLLKSPDYSNYILFAGAILFTDTLGNLPYLLLRAEEKSVQYSLFRAIRFILELLFNILFVVILKYGVVGIIYTTLAVSVVNLLVMSPIIFRHIELRIDLALAREMLLFGLPFLPHGLAYTVIEMVDRFIIPEILDKDALGLYSANYKFGAILSVLILAFRNAWQPFFLKIAKEENARHVYARVMTYFVGGSAMIVIMGTLFVEDLLTTTWPGGFTILGEDYWEGISIIPIILLAYCFYGMYIVMTPGFYIEKKGQYMVLFSGSAALVNVVGNILLIPLFNIWGAAIATLLSYITMAGTIIIVSNYIYPMRIEWGRITRIFLLIGLTAVLDYTFEMSLILRLGLMSVVVLIFYTALLTAEERGALKSLLGSVKSIINKKS